MIFYFTHTGGRAVNSSRRRQLLSRCFSSCFTSSVNAFNITNEHLVRARMLGDVGAAVCDGLRACERGIGSVRGLLLAAGRVSTRCRRLERIFVRTSGDKNLRTAAGICASRWYGCSVMHRLYNLVATRCVHQSAPAGSEFRHRSKEVGLFNFI